jgi:nitrile hydratase
MSDHHDDDHDHDHDDHDHDHHPAPLSEVEKRVAAIESLLVERGLITTDTVDAIVEVYEHDLGPMNGAKVVAHAWTDDAYRARLVEDATSAIAELGFGGAEGEHIVALENTATVHNVVVCTLCSCYPWPVLGLPPRWYKSPEYRSRVVREPRAVLAEFGTVLGDDVEVRVWDSSAEIRYLVLPLAPDDVDAHSEDDLAELVTRDHMIGVVR